MKTTGDHAAAPRARRRSAVRGRVPAAVPPAVERLAGPPQAVFARHYAPGEADLARRVGTDTTAALDVALGGAAVVLTRALELWERQRHGGPSGAALELVEQVATATPDARGIPQVTVTTRRRRRDAWELVDRALARVAHLAEVRSRIVELRALEERLRVVLASLEAADQAIAPGHRLTHRPAVGRLEGPA
jgi:hypothetical protein